MDGLDDEGDTPGHGGLDAHCAKAGEVAQTDAYLMSAHYASPGKKQRTYQEQLQTEAERPKCLA